MSSNCPVCDAAHPLAFFHRSGVPVHQHLLFDTAADARAIPRGDLDLRACGACGFVFNAAFDERLLSYGESYDNTQTHSATFTAYVDELIRDLLTEHNIRTGRVVEVGCGKGVFLTRLLTRATQCSGVGYDPTYLGPEVALDGRLSFVREFYTPATRVPAAVVVCRHVIEHVAHPMALFGAVRASVSSGTKVFFETPCVEWILRHRVAWDLFYEHCSLFSKHSLGTALTRAGFRVTAIRATFGDQYLWAEAVAEQGNWPASGGEVQALAATFAAAYRERVARWSGLVSDLRDTGPAAVWGAGAKGVTFCNLADPAGTALAGVVDVNPGKQGKFLAGTGHRILAPQQATAAGLASAIVLNPNYVPEIQRSLAEHHSRACVIDLMARESAPHVGR